MQNAVAQVQQMMEEYHKFQNPQMYIQQKLQQNPAFQQAITRINQFKDPRAAFYARAKELGVDPEQFLSNFKGGM
jgi:hypothetical protein